MPASAPEYEVPYCVFEISEPMDAVKHFSFESHFGRTHGLPLHLRREFLEGGAETGLHSHDDAYTLTVIRAGRGTVVVNDHPYSLVRGDVYIIPPGAIHGILNYQGIEVDAFYFQAQLFTRTELAALRQLKGFWKLLMHGSAGKTPGGDHRLHLTPVRHREVDSIINDIRSDMSEPQPLGKVMARHLFFRLLARLALWHNAHEVADEAMRYEPASAIDTHTASLAEVIRYCEENFAQPITVPQLAARMFLSPDHFSRLFTTSTGMPPAAFLRRLRLEHAQTMLRTTAIPIADIARQCGLKDPFQFSHAFRAAFDTTPRSYRTKYRK